MAVMTMRYLWSLSMSSVNLEGIVVNGFGAWVNGINAWPAGGGAGS